MMGGAGSIALSVSPDTGPDGKSARPRVSAWGSGGDLHPYTVGADTGVGIER